MATVGKIARRTFLFGAAAIAGGFAFGYYKYRSPLPNPLLDTLGPDEASFNAYIRVSTDNRITVIVPRAEMGQGVTTTLSALVAEELDVRLDQITVEHGPAASAYYNRAALVEGAPVPRFDEGAFAGALRGTMGVISKLLALQFTGGSSSTIDAFEPMRQAGAMAREMLKQAASNKLGVAVSTLETADGIVKDPASGKSLTYGELAASAVSVPPVAPPALRERPEWKILGKSQARVDMRAKVTGAPLFGVDVTLPDMLHATVRMCPYPGGKMAGFDPAAALKMRGVFKIVEIDSPYGKGFGVVADNTWRAFQAADAVTVEWRKPSGEAAASDVFAALDAGFASQSPFSLRTVGDPKTHLADAPSGEILEADYTVPYLAHATMEPMNATAQLKDGILTVWAPNQAPSVIQLVGGRVTGLASEKIMVNTTLLGGGFGRRIEPDFSDYAIRMAMQTEGRPVKVIWTREEDMAHGAYRPAAKGRFKARISAEGMPVAVTGSVASQSVVASMVGRIAPSLPMGGPDNTMIDGSYNQPYEFENHLIEARKVDLPLPVGSWRSVGYSFNAFMQESFLDEIAAKTGTDPLDLRLRLLRNSPAAAGVLSKVAEMANWATPPAKGRARGLAYTLSFGTHVAEVVEIADTPDGIRVEKVWCAADPGLVLDPGIFEAQMMSGIVFGLSAAMFQEITLVDGAVEQTNFGDFPLMRMNQTPEISVALLQQSPFMGGAGEPGTPPSMPALANAIFALTGNRIRTLPLAKAVTFA